MNYRIDKQGLLDTLGAWDGFLKRRVHLIACGGTAMTLLGLNESTKDIDLVVPEEKAYDYLIKILSQLGYKQIIGSGWSKDDSFIFDLFRGKRVHATELLESPLEGRNNILIKEFTHIYLGTLNYYDLIISKIFRAAGADIEDCLELLRAKRKEINIGRLQSRFKETASFDICEEKVNKNFAHFLNIAKKEGLYNEEQ